MATRNRKPINWRVFWTLLSAGVVANVAVLPYALSLTASLGRELPIPLPVAVLIQTIQATGFLLSGLHLVQLPGPLTFAMIRSRTKHHQATD